MNATFPLSYEDFSTSKILPFNLFTTKEVSGTTCIIYEWEVMPSGTTAYSLANSLNVPVIQTFSYPNLTTAATYSPLVAQSEMSRTYNMIEFIAKHQIPVSPYYMKFINQELTPENIEKVQNEM